MKKVTSNTAKTLLMTAILLAGFNVVSANEGRFIFNDLTEDQREELKELHESGDREAVNEFLEDLGIELPENKNERNSEARDAIESDDWDAYQDAVEGTPAEDKITEDEFDILVEAHELREEGDIEGAKELLEENDLGRNKDGDEERPELSEEDKELLEEAKELREDGDHEAAKELLEDLSVEKPEGFFKKMGKKFMGFFRK